MPPEIRRGFVVFAGVVALGALIWAAQFKSIGPADLSFQNGTDPKTLDPHRATGQPESRILFSIFKGLLEMVPGGTPDPETGLQPLVPGPAVAKSYTVSDDGRVYQFQLRDDATWNDGVPINAHDFVWSWTRMLHPETACEYGFQLYALPFAEEYNKAIVAEGDRVEVELWDRNGESPGSEPNIQNFPRGTMVYGTLKQILKPEAPVIPDDASDDVADRINGDWQAEWVYVVDVAEFDDQGNVDWDQVTSTESFCQSVTSSATNDDVTQVHHVLVAFDKLGGVEAVDDLTLVVNLDDPLPYFPYLVAYYPTFPVPRHCIKEHGMPLWTKPENIVTNGPYQVGMRLLRDRVRMVKNPRYFDADNVSISVIDAMSTESANTALNMYETGQLDWITDPPTTLMETLRERDDFLSAPQLTVYFYRINTKRPPMDDPRVRRAIAMAIDRTQIVEQVTKAGQVPAYSLVPPGIAGYESPPGLEPDLQEAKQLLTEAGFPGGVGFPKVTILYNTQDTHRAIAEVIQQQLQNNLNIKLEIQNMEWGSYLDKVNQFDYDIARAGWVADYPDPNTFLDMWVTDGPQNSTGWSNPQFDQLIRDAAAEGRPDLRMKLLAEAESLWIQDMPVIPIYFYVSLNMVKPHVKGFAPTPQDVHPLQLLSLGDRASVAGKSAQAPAESALASSSPTTVAAQRSDGESP
ncbi:MAG: peptide ABC transporter substrate-binding protein [Planctomycetota bacterium]